ncbi:MAG: hypothetical protein COA78_05980 [Blastopirellula sp.]|nr:MAG: hypothetical protein COA78_05980 [Blastopirellula sp.]
MDPLRKKSIQVSSYDNVAGLLIALLVIIGGAVAILVVVFITSRTFRSQVAIPVILEEVAGRGDHELGIARDLEAPGLEELDEILEPQMEMTLEAITDAISSQEATLEALEGNANASGSGGGLGDSRPLGPLSDGDDIIPRYERWEIQFTSTELGIYARQLDSFDIELGSFGGGSKIIEYAKDLAKDQPTRYSGAGGKEERLYMTWKTGSFKEADIDLLNKAGVTTNNRMVMQFYPADTENILANVEKNYANGRPTKEIRKTIFGVKKKGNEYEFYVIRQTYRKV